MTTREEEVFNVIIEYVLDELSAASETDVLDIARL
jgi:hypothetical protein